MSINVTLKPSNREFEVTDGQTILQAALERGLCIPYSCRTGVCRTCRGRVVAGDVDVGGVHPNYLSLAERDQGWVHLCQAKPQSNSVIEAPILEGLADIRPRLSPCRVVGFERPTPQIALLRLRLPPNENMRFLAGQYINILLPNSDRRSYSIANSPSSSGVSSVELHIRHHAGGLFTDHLFNQLKVRDLLQFEGPMGTFYLRENSQKPIILLATGTGFAPIKSMMEHMLQTNVLERRKVTLYWGAREKSDLYARDLACNWAREHEEFHFHPILSAPTEACHWNGRTGYVQTALLEDTPDLYGHQVYACGSPAMVSAARELSTTQGGLPITEFYADAFLTRADTELASNSLS